MKRDLDRVQIVLETCISNSEVIVIALFLSPHRKHVWSRIKWWPEVRDIQTQQIQLCLTSFQFNCWRFLLYRKYLFTYFIYNLLATWNKYLAYLHICLYNKLLICCFFYFSSMKLLSNEDLGITFFYSLSLK